MIFGYDYIINGAQSVTVLYFILVQKLPYCVKRGIHHKFLKVNRNYEAFKIFFYIYGGPKKDRLSVRKFEKGLFMPSQSSWGGGQPGCWGGLHPGQW